jgi:hypothetical protein
MYKDKNRIVNELSKAGIELGQGTWMVSVQEEGNTSDNAHESWILFCLLIFMFLV